MGQKLTRPIIRYGQPIIKPVIEIVEKNKNVLSLPIPHPGDFNKFISKEPIEIKKEKKPVEVKSVEYKLPEHIEVAENHLNNILDDLTENDND